MLLSFKLAQILLRWWYGTIEENILFFHLPKCGGSSVDTAMRRYFPFSHARLDSAASAQAAGLVSGKSDPLQDDYATVLRFREELLLYLVNKPSIRYISGHMSFSDVVYQQAQRRYKLITLLRHPVKRWVSDYFYNRYKTHSDHLGIHDDLLTFLYSDYGKNLGHLYVKMIGGLDPSREYGSQKAIDRAKENLEKFTIVGCLEDLDGFLCQFKRCFGVSLHLPQRNQNPRSHGEIQAALTTEIEEEIMQICRPDLELYTYAVESYHLKGNPET